jgi:hypothetical protein
MAKKNRGPKVSKEPQAQQQAPIEPISSKGKKVIGMGVGILVLGFIVLCFTDPMGRNWASLLSPFLIVGGYVLVGIGIFLPENLPTSGQSQDPSQPPSAL